MEYSEVYGTLNEFVSNWTDLDISYIGEKLTSGIDIGSAFWIEITSNPMDVYSYWNYFYYLGYSTKGGVFHLKSTSTFFWEDYGTYKCNHYYSKLNIILDNFAGLGGSLYCYNCFNIQIYDEPWFWYNAAY